MIQTKISLVDGYKRPVIMYRGLDAVIDTGAEISVWNLPKQTFEIIMDVKACCGNGTIKGFGGKCDGVLYIARKVEIGDIIIKDVPFFVPDTQITENKIIFAGTMFANYAYEIDMKNHVMTLREVF